MKRFLLLIIIFLTMPAGCAASDEPKEKFTLPIRITAKLEGSNAVFVADVRNDGCDVVFDKEHVLSGLELHLRENGNTAQSGEFTRDVAFGTFPAQESFAKAVKLLSSTEESGIPTENGMKYTIDENEIMVYYDKDTELITGIGTEESGRNFKFLIITLEPYEAQSNGAG